MLQVNDIFERVDFGRERHLDMTFIIHKYVGFFSIIGCLFWRIRHVSFFLPPDNIALKKSAWQLHPYPDRTLRDSANASKAVDGLKTDLSYIGHQCTVSANYKHEAEWGVDLGAVLGIHHITIYYRTDNQPWGNIIECFFFKQTV